MAVSILPDIDGLGLLASVDTYQTYHHVLAHNLTFGVLVTLAITWLARCSLKASGAFFVLFHLHLLMDLFGSGPGWGIAYLWPWSDRLFDSSNAWAFYGWQNDVSLSLFSVWTIFIAFVSRRTPFEFVAPRLDALALAALKQKSD